MCKVAAVGALGLTVLALAGCGSSQQQTTNNQSRAGAIKQQNDRVIKQAQGSSDNQAQVGADRIKQILVAKLGMNDTLDFNLNHQTPDQNGGDCYVKLGAEAVSFESQSENILYSPNGKDVLFVQSNTATPLAKCLQDVGAALGWTSGSSGSTATATATTPTVVKKPTDCNVLGINQVKLHEGACTSEGERLYVVNKGDTAHIKSMDVSLVGLRTQDSLSDGSGQSATPHGKFIIATITITNKLHTSQSWQNGQAGMTVSTGAKSGNTYDEDFNAENGPDQNSCEWKIGAVSSNLQPGESITCDVVFDIPTNLSASARGSTVAVAGFGETDLSHPAQRIALLRTYH